MCRVISKTVLFTLMCLRDKFESKLTLNPKIFIKEATCFLSIEVYMEGQDYIYVHEDLDFLVEGNSHVEKDGNIIIFLLFKGGTLMPVRGS